MAGSSDWYDTIFRIVPFVFALVVGAAILIRRVTKADLADVRARIETQGAKVVWVKRLDTQKSDRLFGNGAVTFYDALVERGGVRRIEVWREGSDGIFKDH